MPERMNPELKTHTVNVAFTGDTADFTTTDDSFRMGSQAATHLDALVARRATRASSGTTRRARS